MKKVTAYLTSACVIFTLFTIGLHVAEFALGGGIVLLSLRSASRRHKKYTGKYVRK